MVMRMEYFNKIQCYRPSIGIVDAPVSIDEIALLQDSVDKNMLGRIKFINYSKGTIVAIFVRLRAANIAGEAVTLEKERFIYQDMKISSGELYGNRIPISLPADARYFSVQLEKVVFDDGEVWDALNKSTCKLLQKEIKVPEDIREKIRRELEIHVSDLEYVHYFYEESEGFWECTCGKANSNVNRTCTFCGNSRSSQRQCLTEAKISELVAEKNKEIEEEKRKKILVEAERKRQKENEKRKQEEEWEKHQQEIREQEIILEEKRKKKNKKLLIGSVGIILCAILCCICALRYTKEKKYQQGIQLEVEGEYAQAEQIFLSIKSYKDSTERLSELYEKQEETWKKQIVEDKERLKERFSHYDEYWSDAAIETFTEVLSYMGKSLQFIQTNSNFELVKPEDAKDSEEHGYEFGEYVVEFDYEIFGSYFDSAELHFDENNILCGVRFYGWDEFFYEGDVSKLLDQEIDKEDDGVYSWNIKDESLFSEVTFSWWINMYYEVTFQL